MIHDTEDKSWWIVHGSKLEDEFVNHVVPNIRLKAIINPEKETDPYAPDLVVGGKLVDLKSQNTPFFTAGRKCKNINGKKIPYNPRYTVTFNKKDYLRYKEKYGDIGIIFWVSYKENKKYGIKVLPLAGVWYTGFNELIIRIESGEYELHEYENRKNDTDGNAKDSYLIELRDLELIELFEGEIKSDDF